MADISVEGSVSSVNDVRGTWGPYWADVNNGLLVFNDANSDISTAYTDDGGATWTTTVVETGNDRGVAVFYDKEVPGDTGTTLHVTWLDLTGVDFCKYVAIDVSDGTIGTIRTVDNTVTVSSTSNANRIAITKTVSGNVIVAFTTQSDNDAYKSADQFATAGTAIASPYETATQEDWVKMYPANTADTSDACCLFGDRSVNDLSVKMYDDSADTWTETSISTQVQQHFDHPHFDGAIRHSDGALIVAAHSSFDTAGDDLLTWEILVDSIASPTVTAKTNIYTNANENGRAEVAIDQNNDDVYVAYIKGTTWQATSDVVFHKSTDDLATWGTEQAYSEQTSDDFRACTGPRSITSTGGRIQWSFYNDDLTEIFVNLVNDVEIAAVVAAADETYRHRYYFRR